MKRCVVVMPLLAILALAACETVQGAGRDLSKAGDVIAAESRDVQAGN